MSVRENIQCFHKLNPDEYLRILIIDYGASSHPHQDSAFVVDGVPFYEPKQTDEYMFILGFNLVPLSHV